MIRRLRWYLKRRKIARLKQQAALMYAALPTRQLRRQAERRAGKILGRR